MNTDASLLLLEDDLVLASEIQVFLQKKGFRCDVVYDGALFFRQRRIKTYQLYLLDINVPGMNGLEVCRQIRLEDSDTPIVMITAYGELDDKREGFHSGADDYLVKPFHLDELLMRIEAQMRRKKSLHHMEDEEWLRIEDLELNLTDRKVLRGGTEIPLTLKEYQLLELLAKSKGRTLSKQYISEQLWDMHLDTNLNTIEVYINFLRKKIDRDYALKLIHTRPGFGYYLKAE